MYEGLEKRTNNRGRVSYWKDNEIIYKECSKCGEIKRKEEFKKESKKKDGIASNCKECHNKINKRWRQNNPEASKEYSKQYRQNNSEKIKEARKKYYKENAEVLKEKTKQWLKENPEYARKYREENAETIKEKAKLYYLNNVEHIKEQHKVYRDNNREKKREHDRKYIINNKEKIKIRRKEQYKENKTVIKEKYENNKKENIKNITNMIERVDLLKDLPIYGTIYKFENVKTGKCYIGQTILPINVRYPGNTIKSWIRERIDKGTQKFKEELIEENIRLTPVIAIGYNKYHLDKLEVYYINKYNSFNNGYNNNAGCHDSDDGIEEFNELLQKYNLQFIDGKLIECA